MEKWNVVLNTSLFYRYGIVRFILVCGHKKRKQKDVRVQNKYQQSHSTQNFGALKNQISHNARSLIAHSLSHSLSHSFSLSLSSITVMLSYFLALATRPALWMAETLAKAFFRKSGRVAHAASTALAWFLKMPLLFAPFNVEDGVFVPANSWISIVLLLAIPGLVGC